MSKLPIRAALLANVLGYQLVWFACVAGAAANRTWPGLLAALAFTGLTLCFGGRWRQDLGMLVLVLPLGLALDSSFVLLGAMSYSPPATLPALLPAWIAAIWLAFAMTLNHSLAFMRRRVQLASVLGLVAAPLAYWGASRGFGVVHFAEPRLLVMAALGLSWAILLPSLYLLDSRLHRQQAEA